MHRLAPIAFLLSAAAAFPAEPAFAPAGPAFLAKYCNSCHSGEKPKADLSLTGLKDNPSLVKERKTIARVLEVMHAGEMPPPNKMQPPGKEKDDFLQLVNAILDHADKNAKPDPGRVTMRRLNRKEYNNTVRDLCFVDFTPAQDFPSDDIGHGFDNIGDVLSLPPVLMERYLGAAEAVMEKAILAKLPKPVERWQGAQYTEPAGRNVPMKDKWRIVSSDGQDAQNTGPVNTPYDVPAGDDYTFHTRVYAETAGTKPVKAAILAYCEPGAPGIATPEEAATLVGHDAKGLRAFKILKVVEVASRESKKSQEIRFDFRAPPGFKRTAIALVKPAEGEPAAKLYLQHLGLIGPLDMRPPSMRMLLSCDPKKPVAEQSREVLARFATRAYRRPATTDEVNRLVQLAEAAIARGDSWETAMQFAMTAVLASPKFLFRVELDDRPTERDPRPIDDYALASRLSYFLWSSMPDEELFALAAKRQLAANLDAQVKRMLKDPKAETLIDSFAMQWLQLERLNQFQPDPKQFPKFDEHLKAAMLQETKLFLKDILREDRSILTILDADYTYVNAALANHYGMADTAGNLWSTDPKKKRPGGKPLDWSKPNTFFKVSLEGSARGGILTQASVLAVTSNPTRTSPVKRGKWVLEQMLGTPPPPAPPDVPELEKDGKAVSAGTLRQRMELHRQNVACANCHAKMDPLGFGLENFDAVGAYRTKDAGADLDVSGELPDGQKFQGPAELRKILLGKKDLFTKCLAEKMLTYALGRGLEYYDKRPVDAITAEVAKNDYKFSALVSAIVRSDPFTKRR
jgi:hypothetical protein